MTARHWCFTLNNPDDGLDLEASLRRDDVRYAIWQKEAGESGTPHLQGYVEFTKPVRLSALQKIVPRCHGESRRGTREQARDYCRKEESRLAGPWEVGTWSGTAQGRRTDLESAAATARSAGSLYELADKHPVEYVKFGRGLRELRNALCRKRRRLELKVYLIWGTSGAGKTRYVWDMWGENGGVYSLASQKPLWFDGYDNEETLLIDEFVGVEEFGRENLLKVLDIYPHQFPVKGSMIWPQWKRVYILSNQNYKYAFQSDEALWRRVKSVEQV